MHKYLLQGLFLLAGFFHVNAQPGDYTSRSALDSSLAPFYHGVASGDPTPNSVILWTRVTPDLAGPVTVNWHIALDTTFSNVLFSGNVTTDSSTDYTVKVDVDGLQPNTWYYYEFTTDGKNSLTGRTKTAPVGGMDQLRFAFVSCSNYPVGYFNAYEDIWRRNDIDAVFHLGDYIYEGGGGGIRTDQLPNYEIVRLADYRLRHSSIKLDPSLLRLHQQFPFMTVWDDHETANNSWMGGAEGHDSLTQGPWMDRKLAGQQAYDEWMPIRLPEAGNENKIWRKLSYGNLADVFMLDTRLYARTVQNNAANNPDKHIIGDEQLEWLKTELLNSTAKWKILSQQVMMGQLTPFGITVNSDQWDGYAAERKKLYDFILDNNIQNIIVLTGDIHTAWAMDLPYKTSTYNPFTGAGSVGVEFVCTSVTSTSSPVPLDGIYGLIETILPHIKYVDLHKKGFGILDLKETQAQGDFYSVNTIETPDTTYRFEAGYYTLPTTRWLKKANRPAEKLGDKQYYAPFTPRTSTVTGIRQNTGNLVIVSAYPNPCIDKIYLQYNIFQSAPVTFEVYDMSGRLVKSVSMGTQVKGLHIEELDLGEVARGQYKLVLRNNNDVLERSIQKF